VFETFGKRNSMGWNHARADCVCSDISSWDD
jgi:hypothetical protein